MKNEQTSKRVASKAGELMAELEGAMYDLSVVYATLEKCKSVCASALTQSPNKSKGKRK